MFVGFPTVFATLPVLPFHSRRARKVALANIWGLIRACSASPPRSPIVRVLVLALLDVDLEAIWTCLLTMRRRILVLLLV